MLQIPALPIWVVCLDLLTRLCPAFESKHVLHDIQKDVLEHSLLKEVKIFHVKDFLGKKKNCNMKVNVVIVQLNELLSITQQFYSPSESIRKAFET